MTYSPSAVTRSVRPVLHPVMINFRLSGKKMPPVVKNRSV